MLFPNKRKYIGIGIGQNELKNIVISDIGKNPILCIPRKYITLNIYLKFPQPVPQLGHPQQKDRPTLFFFFFFMIKKSK